MSDNAAVWLVTSGDGDYGSPWQLHSIHATEEGALAGKAEYEVERTRPDGSTYHYDAEVEEWPVDK